jgi:hypothetical protein
VALAAADAAPALADGVPLPPVSEDDVEADADDTALPVLVVEDVAATDAGAEDPLSEVAGGLPDGVKTAGVEAEAAEALEELVEPEAELLVAPAATAVDDAGAAARTGATTAGAAITGGGVTMTGCGTIVILPAVLPLVANE